MSAAQDPVSLPEAESLPQGRQEPRARRRWEAADTVIALVSALIIVIFAIFGFLCWQGFGQALESARNRAQTTADIVATQSSWLLGGGLAALRIVESKLAFEPAVLDPEDKAELDNALKVLPAGGALALYDTDGTVLENGGSPALPASISGTGYFAELTGGGRIETIAPQEADATTGAPIIVMARRLGTEVTSGFAVLALPAGALDSFAAPLALTADSTISLIRDDGMIIARHPPLAQPMDMATASEHWAQIADSDAGTYDSGASPAEGVGGIVGYRHVPRYGVIATGSVARDAALAPLWGAIGTVLWLLVPFALALFGGSLLTARLLRQSARAQRTLAAAVAHNDVLFREIHHRVKNNLQSVASLLQMQPIPREIKANMGQRIAAMSAVHEHIYRSNDFETVRVHDYLHTLIASVRAGSDPRIEVTEAFETLAIDRDAATPLGLIVNEVVSNAFKHAFPDGRAGHIVVRVEATPEGGGRLTIEDDGAGYDPDAPAKGIGRRLVTALTMQLGGVSQIEARPGGGSRFTLDFPLAGTH